VTAAKPRREVRFTAALGFKGQYRTYLAKFPEIAETIKTFNENKRKLPPEALPGKMRDHVLKGPLAGIRECHLAPDVLLLYTHEDDVVNMLYVCEHNDLYGKRQRQLASQVARIIKGR
jgi:addiction module RelE/StbE family toxin